MSYKRQLKRKAAQKAQKQAKVKAKRALNELAAMPDSCAVCEKKFDIKDDFCLDNWIVKVTDAGIKMYCDACRTKS